MKQSNESKIKSNYIVKRRKKKAMKKKSFHSLFYSVAIVMLMLSIMAFGLTPPAAAAEKTVAAGATWTVSQITHLTGLTISNDATVNAPEGYSLTLTVDGVETGMKPGTYMGDIVLTPTKKIFRDNYEFRTAIDVENGKYMPDSSVAAAVVGGTVTSSEARDVKITSVGEKFNGIMVTGDSKFSYSIVNPVINLTGNGANDFVGYGAAIMTAGKAQVTIDKANINNTGAVRTAIWVGGDSVTTVNDSYIEVHNGTLPEGYEFSVAPGKMMEVPWMLGIIGNLRATNVTGNGTAYYNNTHIKAQGWGALSSDNVTDHPHIYATNCLIETTESGYGAFSLGTNVGTFSKCTFNVKDMALISQDGDGVFTDGTVVNSGRFGVMYWGSDAKLTIDKNCVFNTKSTAILLKGGSTDIVVDSSKLNPKNGIILQMMANDDPNQMGGGGGPGGGMPPGGSGAPPSGGAPQAGAPSGGGMPAGGNMGAPPGGMPPQGGAPPQGGVPGGTGGGGMPGGGSTGKIINATFSNMTLNGDMVNGNTASADLDVTFKNATITGAITTASLIHVLGPNGEKITMEHPELYYLIGEVTNTFCAMPKDKHGATVTLDAGSTWLVSKTSYLTGLTLAKDATLSAPAGYIIVMTVDGVKKPIAAGTYKGSIVLTVAKK